MKEYGVVRRRLSGKEADPYLGLSRKILGEMKNIMRLGGIQQLSWTKDLQNGVRIFVSSIMGQDEIRIFVKTGGGTAPVVTPKYLDIQPSQLIMVGIDADNNGFVWEKGELTMLDGIVSGRKTQAYAISGDGRVIVGTSESADIATSNPVRWVNGAIEVLDSEVGDATGVSENGSVICGTFYPTDTYYRAFRWTAKTGAVALPMADTYVLYYDSSLEPQERPQESYADAISRDGSTIVGFGSITSFPIYRALMWKNSSVTELGVIPGLSTSITYPDNSPNWYTGSAQSYATGVSAKGDIVVGYCTWKEAPSTSSSDRNHEAFRWENGAMAGLGYLTDYNRSAAYAISDDGRTIVGSCWNEGSPNDRKPFVWTKETGMVELEGYDVTSDTNEAYCVVNNGKVQGGKSHGQAVYWIDGKPVAITTGVINGMTYAKKTIRIENGLDYTP